MTVADVAIVGGGIAGCSAALHLRQRGASVVLLERKSCGSEASGVNYGGVRQQGRHPAELPLARRSRALWSKLESLVGTDCEFSVSGHLKLARSDSEYEELNTYAAHAETHGLSLKLIPAEQIRRTYPWLSNDVVGGSLCAEDGHANPRLVAPAVMCAARHCGADVCERVTVTRVEHRNGTFVTTLSDGQHVQSRGLINAAGAWAFHISAAFGEPVPEDVMAPNMCVTEPIPHFIWPNLGVCGGDIYIRQIERGNVIFGGGEGIADRDAIRSYPQSAVTATAIRAAVSLVPDLANTQVIRTWSGIEGVMPDGLPVVGRSRTTPGLVHTFGFSGHGFQLGLGVGAVASELVLDGGTDTEIDELSIGRFDQLDVAASGNA